VSDELGRATNVQAAMRWDAHAIAVDVPPIAADTTCREVFEHFSQNSNLDAAAIVDPQMRPVGIVNRLRFLARYAQPYIPELFSRRPIVRLANPHPLVVEDDVGLTALGTMLTIEWPDALREGFIVTSGGKYFGIGTSETLVRAKLQLLLNSERQLTDALNNAEHANRAKSNFLALMSHELRTPLNAIIGFSEVMKLELLGPHEVGRYRDYSSDIHKAGAHLLELINDILDLSKSEAGKMVLTNDVVDLGELFEDGLKLLSERARSGSVGMQFETTDDLPLLHADALRIRQILLNLMSNAVKFTLPGGRVTVRAGKSDDRSIVIEVEDTGIGMARESIPRALEPFRQIDSPLSRKVEGTGLGLSLVKSLVELHGATLKIESELEVGTKVTIRFPPERTVDHPASAAWA
jgi:two-component system cell cycle sensor histidine kinase PleC